MSAMLNMEPMPSVLVPVMRDKYARGWPEHETGFSAAYFALADALTRDHATDAHFAAYSVPDKHRRLASPAVFEHLPDGVPMVLFVVDVEPDGHAEVTPEWWTAERAKIDRLLGEHPGGYVYRTRGGYRVVYVLAEPFVMKSAADTERWKATYLAWINYIAERFDIIGDKSCQDWTRLQRLPRVVRDGVRQEPETIGDATAIGTWNVEVAIPEPAPKRPATPSPSYVPKAGAFDPHAFMAARYPGVQSRSTATAERYDIECPWSHDHSVSSGARETSVFVYPSGAWEFKCLHNHCAHRDHVAFRRWHQPDWTPYEERTINRSHREPPRSGDDAETESANGFDDSASDVEPDYLDDIPPPGDEHAPSSSRKRKRDGQGAVKLATDYIADHASHPDGALLRRWRGDFYRWCVDAGHYRPLSDDQIRADLYRKLGLGRRAEVGEVRDALIAVDNVLIDDAELGTWLDDRHGDFDPLDIAACRNSILHLPTRTTYAATPRYFSTTALGVAWQPQRPAPEAWLSFLHQLWPGDDESIGLLQEWIGYLLTADTRQQKILLLLGPKRSGKGTIARVIGALLGAASVASPTLASLGTNFGLWPLIGKTAAVIGDARLGGRSDIAQVVERLLSISGEDLQTVDRKHREPWTGKLATRITIISNEPPRFTDASDALACRMLVLQLERSFYGNEDTELTDKLVAELPGILAWAIDGWERLRARGHFVQPASSRDAIDELIDLASPVAAWARQNCRTDERDPQWWLTCTDAYSKFQEWCEQQGHKQVATMTMFGRDVQTATGCRRVQVTRGLARVGVYQGLALR
jgi:putative DNA primase/helicase